MADEVTRYGFVWGPMEVTRTATLPQSRGHVLTLKTPRKSLEIYVTPTGLVRVFDNHRELKLGVGTASRQT